MARIPYPDTSQSPPDVQAALEGVRLLNIYRMLATAPTLIRPFMRLGSHNFTTLELSDRLREIAILASARATNANYEWAQHVRIGKRVGIEPEAIAAIKARQLDTLTSDDRAVAEFATSVTEDVAATDESFAAVHALLGDRQTVELLLVVGFYNMVARFLETLQIDLEADAEDTLRPA